MQAILHQSRQHNTQNVHKNAPKQYALVRILLGLFIVPLLSSEFPTNPAPITFQVGRDCTYPYDFEHYESWQEDTIKHFFSITNLYFCSYDGYCCTVFPCKLKTDR